MLNLEKALVALAVDSDPAFVPLDADLEPLVAEGWLERAPMAGLLYLTPLGEKKVRARIEMAFAEDRMRDRIARVVSR